MPTAAHTPSPPPQTTGVLGQSPVNSLAVLVIYPAISVDFKSLGIFCLSMPIIFNNSSDQHNLFKSIKQVEEASLYSVTN